MGEAAVCARAAEQFLWSLSSVFPATRIGANRPRPLGNPPPPPPTPPQPAPPPNHGRERRRPRLSRRIRTRELTLIQRSPILRSDVDDLCARSVVRATGLHCRQVVAPLRPDVAIDVAVNERRGLAQVWRRH